MNGGLFHLRNSASEGQNQTCFTETDVSPDTKLHSGQEMLYKNQSKGNN